MPISDILILSNGPGELATWVRPVVKALREQLGDDRSAVRISVVLSPCPNASGKEAEIAQSYPEVDRVQGAEKFWEFLLWGKTAENWDWRDRGVVLFLGGDQIFPVVIGKRLGYRTVIYAEWDARWHSLIDRFGVMKPELVARVPQKYAHKFSVVGDLMAEAAELNTKNEKLEISEAIYPGETIGLLPGSKPAKLAQGVPLCLAIAECIYAKRPQTRFVIPVAPTLDLKTLARFADPRQNPVIELVKGATAELITPDPPELPYLKTAAGVRVELWTRSPAYDLLSQCSLCFTTVGANTAELAALAVPMIVLLPTQQLDAMRSWDGLPGLLANLPVLGSSFAKAINWIIMQKVMEQGRLYAWPNIWAKTQIVPELLGKLQAAEVAEFSLDYLNHPEKLQEMRDRLRSIRGEAGAAQKLAKLVCEELERQNA
ncbi:lipid-A-disaccharide synthase [Coleofasciculus sp. FACHB-T130]|uniref:lipid-A-disaccharide synthase n=1 Tax=Cyanophyceae TaxID=3028117 RepID=UPI0016883F02|nr:lipid-A-disaccharide synthase [Coleofasciculus sp. FACHB-T130]MBD1879505.1 lipid-A-disaccharide synthase [Coleofasciculus sp. FACHB-T130]